MEPSDSRPTKGNQNSGKMSVDNLQRALKYSASILETIHECLVVLDAGLKVVSANKSFYNLFSLTPGEVEGKLIYEVGRHELDIPALRRLLEELLPQNTFFERFEVRHGFNSLGHRTMLLNARRIYSEGQKTETILLAIEDVTEHKSIEERLAFSELRYRRLFETAQDGILILDAKTAQITDVNPFLEKMLGYTRSDLLGKKLWEIGAVKDIEASRNAFLTLQKKEYIRYENLPLQTRDGRRIDVEFVSNVYSVNGNSVIQCNVRDITERKRMADLKEAFLNMVTHELRTPLTVVIGSLKTAMAEGMSPEDIRQLVSNAAEGSDSLAVMLENLLEITRYQAERLELHASYFSIYELVESIMGQLRRLYSNPFTNNVPKNLQKLRADRARLERIIYNLLENAAKYSPENNEVTVSAQMNDSSIALSVADRGCGMTPEETARLFEPFERLKQKSGNLKGLGLGLVVCKHLVDAHGGRISVESQVGKGTTFTFTIPTS